MCVFSEMVYNGEYVKEFRFTHVGLNAFLKVKQVCTLVSALEKRALEKRNYRFRLQESAEAREWGKEWYLAMSFVQRALVFEAANLLK